MCVMKNKKSIKNIILSDLYYRLGTILYTLKIILNTRDKSVLNYNYSNP